MASNELLTRLKIRELDGAPTSNSLQSAIFKLAANPIIVRHIPRLVDWVLTKPNINIGASMIVIPMVGTISLLLVNVNNPKPRKKHNKDR